MNTAREFRARCLSTGATCARRTARQLCTILVTLAAGTARGATEHTYMLDRDIQTLHQVITAEELNVRALHDGAARLTSIVGPFNLIDPQTSATRSEVFAWDYAAPSEAWDDVMSKYHDSGTANKHVETYNTTLFDNPGWIKGAVTDHGGTVGFLWLLQNHLTFQSCIGTSRTLNGQMFVIEKVLVGTLGDFPPGTTVSRTWPRLDPPADERQDMPPGSWLTSDTPQQTEDVIYRHNLDSYYKLANVRVEIAAVDRVPLYGSDPFGENEKSVTITITPSPLPDGASVSLSCEPLAGTVGDADVIPTSITQTTTVKLRGTVQSWSTGTKAAPDSVVLAASVSGVVRASERFTVCAHVANFSNTYVDEVETDGIEVKVTWTSDSGVLGDLDRSRIREKVLYPLPFIPPSSPVPWPAPFQARTADNNPLERPKDGLDAKSGFETDEHTWDPGVAEIAATPITGVFDAVQRYQDKCERCGRPFTYSSGQYTIRRETLAPSGLLPRRFRISKTGPGLGASATRIIDIP